MGNICNAGDEKKGRADGFNYDAITATLRSKAASGDSMLKVICLKLNEEEEGFSLMPQNFKDCVSAQRSPIATVQASADKLKSGLTIVKALFVKVKADDPDIPLTQFGKAIQSFLDEVDPQVEEMTEAMDKVHKEYEQTCDLYMIDKSDEKRTQSEKLFEFFNEFFDNIEKIFPRKRRASTQGLNPQILAELQRRQSMMNKTQT